MTPPPNVAATNFSELLSLANLIVQADDVSLLVLTVRGKRAGIDPKLLRQMAALLLAYQADR